MCATGFVQIVLESKASPKPMPMLFTRPPHTARCCTLLLLWLVMLALPLQGFAAAAMVHCGSGPAQSVHTGPHMQSGHHHAAMANMQAHHHVSDAMVQQADTAENSLATSFQAKAGFDINHSCSACAACCNLMALATSVPTVAPPAVATVLFLDLPLPALGIAPRLSEKPPRL